jgi:hypothetical protein
LAFYHGILGGVKTAKDTNDTLRSDRILIEKWTCAYLQVDGSFVGPVRDAPVTVVMSSRTGDRGILEPRE